MPQEKDVDAHHSALALERYLKEIGVHEVWIRGYSEAKLLDADPEFHSFQDVKHIQTCDVFIALINQVALLLCSLINQVALLLCCAHTYTHILRLPCNDSTMLSSLLSPLSFSSLLSLPPPHRRGTTTSDAMLSSSSRGEWSIHVRV